MEVSESEWWAEHALDLDQKTFTWQYSGDLTLEAFTSTAGVEADTENYMKKRRISSLLPSEALAETSAHKLLFTMVRSGSLPA